MALDLKMEIFAHNSFYRIWNKGVKEKENLNIHQIYGEECCKIENVSEACEEVLISEERAFSKEMECTETPIEHVGNGNHSDDLQTTHFSEINQDVSKEKSTEASYPEDIDNQTEIARRKEVTSTSGSTSQMIKSDKVENSSSYFLPPQQFIDSFIDNLYSSNTEMKKKTPTSPEVLLTDQTDKSFQNKEAKLEVMAAQKCCTENEDASNNDKEIRNEKSVEMSYSENGDDRREISRRMEIPSTSQMIKSDKDENSSSYFLPPQQFIDSFIDNLYSSNTEMKKKTPTSPEVLLTDQTDKSFQNKEAKLEVMAAQKFCTENEDASNNDKEIRNEKSVEMSYSENGDDRREISRRMEIPSTSQMIKSDKDENSSSYFLPPQQFIDSFIDNLYSSNTEMKKKTPTSPEVLLTDQTDKSFQNKEAKLEVMAAQKFCTENEDASNNDKEIRNEKSVEMSYSENGDDRREISRRMEIPSTSQMIKSDKDENSSSYFLPPQQFIDSFIDNLYSSNTEMKKKTPTSPEVLLTDQTDKSFQNKEAKLEVMAAQKFCTENEDASNNDKEIRNEKSVEMSYSENGDDRTEISRRMEITSTSKLTESYMDENSSLILPKQFIDNLYSSNTEKRIETPTPTEVLSTKQMDKTFHYPYKVKNTWNFCSKSRDTNDKVEEVNSDKSLDVSCCSKKEEEQSEIIREADIISTSQMDEPEWNTNITPDVLLKPKVFDFENQGGSIGDEIEKIETSREDLRKEQDDREINIFLRMILILSDRQRAKFVHQEFLDNEVTPQNVQELLDNEETSQNVQELLGNEETSQNVQELLDNEEAPQNVQAVPNKKKKKSKKKKPNKSKK
ncbi:uncharacterized protein LOC129958749 [Argiope bruennichi]|uniref:uncharacterized protein LOC129958749 n=1 Tax=Argiope bruennichi TaxID=94029 RepID=UPI002494BE20|nr:uncharacterized protein LOC129958749 [Argiope bruennichi]